MTSRLSTCLRSSRHAAATLLAALAAAALSLAQAGEPAPGGVSPNASRVKATVLERKIWPAGSLKDQAPFFTEDQLYSVRVKVIASEAAEPHRSHLAETGRTLDLFSATPLPEEVIGQTLALNIELTGGTQGLRWIIRGIENPH